MKTDCWKSSISSAPAKSNYVGNIYKGRIVNLEPSIQAAFVDFGVGRNGFLHISDVEPQYFRQGGYDPRQAHCRADGGHQRPRSRLRQPRPIDDIDDDPRTMRRDRSRKRHGDERRAIVGNGRGTATAAMVRRRPQLAACDPPRQRTGVRPRFKPPIQEIFQRGDEVLVQVIKEGIGTKGPTLSTYISIPGRYLVLMPAPGPHRRLAQDRKRRRPPPPARHLRELNPPKGVGFIVRTAGTDRTKKELSRDLAYLLRLWKVIVRRIKKTTGPVDIYEESDMIIRTIRDIFTGDVDTIYIDEPQGLRAGQRVLADRHAALCQSAASSTKAASRCSTSTISTRKSRRSTSGKVPLRSGGSLVIDQTEALVAIDVNSGNFRTDGSAEESAYQLNQIAAREIARQLRLRDLGGVVVNDFIDMRKERNRRGVERTLRDAVKRDRARTKILRTSPFGLIEMTRQRIRPSIKRSVYKECPCCTGTGLVKSAESMAIEVVRKLLLCRPAPNRSPASR